MAALAASSSVSCESSSSHDEFFADDGHPLERIVIEDVIGIVRRLRPFGVVICLFLFAVVHRERPGDHVHVLAPAQCFHLTDAVYGIAYAPLALVAVAPQAMQRRRYFCL